MRQLQAVTRISTAAPVPPVRQLSGEIHPMFMPFQVLGIWLRGLLAVGILGLGIGLLWDWNRNRQATASVTVPTEPMEADRTITGADRDQALPPRELVTGRPAWRFGVNWPTAELLAGIALLGWTLGVPRLGLRLMRRSNPDDLAGMEGFRGETRSITRPDGSVLHAEISGPEDAPPIVLTHGWGANSREWAILRKDLGSRYRLIAWDLAGLGQSTAPTNADYSLEKMAKDLHAVLDLAGDRPAVLVGHSIGGMINLTFCRLFPEEMGRRVSAIAIVHSTYTNPVRTTKGSTFYRAIQKPILEPLCHLMIWLAPALRVMILMGYVNGSAHRSTERSGFSGEETREQLDFMARFQLQARPAVVARGMLGMFRYDATATLPTISVPVLVVAADRDTITLPEASRVMAETIPGASLVTLAPTKHLGLIEHHGRFAEALDRFVSESIPTGANPRILTPSGQA